MDVNRAWYGEDHCTVERLWHGTVPGEFLGVPGYGRKISSRMLHVFEFRDGRISRENVWLDGSGIVAQLTAEPEAGRRPDVQRAATRRGARRPQTAAGARPTKR